MKVQKIATIIGGFFCFKKFIYAMPNKWFEEFGLCSLYAIYKERHLQRG